MTDVCFSKPEVVISSRGLKYVDEIWTDFDIRMRVTSSTTKPEVVLSHRCRHLEIVYNVITPTRVARFGRHLVA